MTGLGNRLYVKITEVLSSEIAEVTQDDCIDYIIKLVINRTYDGYMSEKDTIYGQLQDILKTKIIPAPDEWDRLYNVDFYINKNSKYIGLQIKPAGGVSHIPEIYKEYGLQAKTHQQFKQKYGGSVFYIISIKQGDKKVIYNPDVIEEIKGELQSL